MKFSTSLITFLFAATAFAATSNMEVDLSKIKLDDFGLGNDSACDTALETYEECLKTTILEDTTKDKNCEIIKSEKCQNFFKNGVKSVKGCENVNELKLKLENVYLKTALYSLNMECAKDEKGKFCPLSSISAEITARTKNKNSQVTDDEFKSVYTDSVMNTCNSKACINAAIEFQSGCKEIKKDYELIRDAFRTAMGYASNTKNSNIPVIKSANTTTTTTSSKTKRSFNFNNIDLNSEEGIDQLIDITADYLKSEECTTNAGNLSSGAITLKYSVALMVTLALFLFQLA